MGLIRPVAPMLGLGGIFVCTVRNIHLNLSGPRLQRRGARSASPILTGQFGGQNTMSKRSLPYPKSGY